MRFRNKIPVIVFLLFIAGCGQNVGYVIKPVTLDERLKETVVATDPGLFIHDKVAIVDLDGLLLNDRDMGMFSFRENPVSLFVEKLDTAQADPAVKALIVRINSPGGAVTATDIIYQRLARFKAARKVPVVAVIEDVGASGGYYVACACDAVIAHPTSVTGSIGVMVQTVSFAGTMDKIGITARAVTSGRYKDMASPLKPIKDEDIAIIQGMVDSFYKRFVEVVQSGRPAIKPEKIKELADGRVFTGLEAKENGLVDGVGYMEDAIALAKTSAGLSRVKVVMYHRPLGYRSNFYSSAAELNPQVQLNLVNLSVPGILRAAQPQFLYLWSPGLQ